jgi:hypothetical protein
MPAPVSLGPRALLGDDPHSVLSPEPYEGLRASQGAGHVVPAAQRTRAVIKLSSVT